MFYVIQESFCFKTFYLNLQSRESRLEEVNTINIWREIVERYFVF